MLSKPPRLSSQSYWLLAVLMAILYLASTRQGLIVSFDSIQYLRLAKGFWAGQNEIWKTGYGPLPGMLPALFGENALRAWQFLHLGTFLMLAQALPAFFAAKHSFEIARSWALLCLSSLAILGNAHFALSELLFMLMLIHFWLCFRGWKVNPTPRLYLLLFALGIVMCLQRQSGVFVLAGAFTILIFQKTAPRTILTFSVLSLCALLPLFAWNISYGPLTGAYLLQKEPDWQVAISNLSACLDTLSGWFLPRILPAWLRQLVAAILLAGLWISPSKSIRELLILMAVYILGTWFFTLKLSGALDPSEAERFMSPMFPFLLLASLQAILAVKVEKASWQWIFYGYLCTYTLGRCLYYMLAWQGIMQANLPL